jgi:hypothetical protein
MNRTAGMYTLCVLKAFEEVPRGEIHVNDVPRSVVRSFIYGPSFWRMTHLVYLTVVGGTLYLGFHH